MILSGRIINPGELRTPVVLGKRLVVRQAGGTQAVVFSPVTGVPARWKNVHGAEAWQASAQGVDQPADCLIRYRGDLDATWLVKKDNRVYEIVSVDDINERHEYMELKVKRWSEA